MSHIAKINLEVRDLEALKLACEQIGCELVMNQKTYRWYGRIVGGERVMPEGYSLDEVGKCEHAIRAKGNPDAYEIGLVSRRDGKPGYALVWDNYRGGMGLADYVGQETGKLKQHYAAQVAMKTARQLGHRVVGTTMKADGSMVVRIQQ